MNEELPHDVQIIQPLILYTQNYFQTHEFDGEQVIRYYMASLLSFLEMNGCTDAELEHLTEEMKRMFKLRESLKSDTNQ